MAFLDPKIASLAPTLRGQIDSVTPHVVRGWAYDSAWPGTPVELVVTDRGEELGLVLAEGYREDLVQAGLGAGCHGFEFWLPTRLSPHERHVVRVFRRSDGRELFYSPVVVEPSEAFGPAFKSRIEEVVRAPVDEVELKARIAFFLEVAEELKQRHADTATSREVRARERSEGLDHAQLRALVIDSTLPDETRDAGSNAILSHVRSLKRLGYDVTFVPSDLAGHVAAAAALRAEGIRPALAPSIASVEELLRRQRDTFDLVYIHRLENAVRYASLVRCEQPSAHIVYSIADLHHVRMARQAIAEGDASLREIAEITRIRELQCARDVSAVVTHSQPEAAMLRAALPDLRVHVVPWAVQLDPIVRPFEARSHVGFLGGFRHAPNVDAAHRLVTRIMPLVWATHPQIKLVIMGSDVPDEVRQLARKGVEISGHAPDLFLVMNRLRLMVAPLAYGAGIKGKVLESLAHGLPCMMTPIAAEGLDLPSDFDASIAAADAEIAAAIVRLHEEPAANAALAQAGLAYVAARWNEQAVDAALAPACAAVAVVEADNRPERSSLCHMDVR